MAKTKPATRKKAAATETDSAYLLKLVLYLILGSQWLWLERADGGHVPIPVGLLVGIIFAMHDHFAIDRKIEYALLLVATVIGYIASVGIFFNV